MPEVTFTKNITFAGLLTKAFETPDGKRILWGPISTEKKDYDGDVMDKAGIWEGLKTYEKFGGHVDYGHGYLKSVASGSPKPGLIIGKKVDIREMDGVPCMATELFKGNPLAEEVWDQANRGCSFGYSVQGIAKAHPGDPSRKVTTEIHMITIDPMPKNEDCRLQVGMMPMVKAIVHDAETAHFDEGWKSEEDRTRQEVDSSRLASIEAKLEEMTKGFDDAPEAVSFEKGLGAGTQEDPESVNYLGHGPHPDGGHSMQFNKWKAVGGPKKPESRFVMGTDKYRSSPIKSVENLGDPTGSLPKHIGVYHVATESGSHYQTSIPHYQANYMAKGAGVQVKNGVPNAPKPTSKALTTGSDMVTAGSQGGSALRRQDLAGATPEGQKRCSACHRKNDVRRRKCKDCGQLFGAMSKARGMTSMGAGSNFLTGSTLNTLHGKTYAYHADQYQQAKKAGNSADMDYHAGAGKSVIDHLGKVKAASDPLSASQQHEDKSFQSYGKSQNDFSRGYHGGAMDIGTQFRSHFPVSKSAVMVGGGMHPALKAAHDFHVGKAAEENMDGNHTQARFHTGVANGIHEAASTVKQSDSPSSISASGAKYGSSNMHAAHASFLSGMSHGYASVASHMMASEPISKSTGGGEMEVFSKAVDGSGFRSPVAQAHHETAVNFLHKGFGKSASYHMGAAHGAEHLHHLTQNFGGVNSPEVRKHMQILEGQFSHEKKPHEYDKGMLHGARAQLDYVKNGTANTSKSISDTVSEMGTRVDPNHPERSARTALRGRKDLNPISLSNPGRGGSENLRSGDVERSATGFQTRCSNCAAKNHQRRAFCCKCGHKMGNVARVSA